MGRGLHAPICGCGEWQAANVLGAALQPFDATSIAEGRGKGGEEGERPWVLLPPGGAVRGVVCHGVLEGVLCLRIP
jgi:hypothetical protein